MSQVPAPAPEESGFQGIINAGKGALNKFMGNSQESHPMGGKIVQYNGKYYNVDSNGNMTEVKK